MNRFMLLDRENIKKEIDKWFKTEHLWTGFNYKFKTKRTIGDDVEQMGTFYLIVETPKQTVPWDHDRDMQYITLFHKLYDIVRKQGLLNYWYFDDIQIYANMAWAQATGLTSVCSEKMDDPRRN